MKEYGPIGECQACDYPGLSSVLFLGYLPPVNAMLPIGSTFDVQPWFPAEMLYCPRCHLVQLGYAVDPKVLFPPEYPYTSGSTRILRENFADLYKDVKGSLGIEKSDLIVDIGSNDGTLLSNFMKGGHRVLGIEPSLQAKKAEAAGIPTIMKFFDAESVAMLSAQWGQPKVVTATNVFAHIHNVHRVIDNIERLTGDQGVFISESHYLLGLVQTLQYDTIYHEHLRYYSLTSIKNLLESRGFKVFDVKRIPTHGGSIRVYASKSSKWARRPAVDSLLREEVQAGLTGETWSRDFRNRVAQSKLDLYRLLSDLKKDSALVYGIGAPSRASTLITYVGLDESILPCVLEIKGSMKVDKYVPGTKIPVLDEAKLYADQPPYVLLLSWHIASELCGNLKRHGYRGDYIVPLPTPHIIRSDEVKA